jgi:hypothetical protein
MDKPKCDDQSRSFNRCEIHWKFAKWMNGESAITDLSALSTKNNDLICYTDAPGMYFLVGTSILKNEACLLWICGIQGTLEYDAVETSISISPSAVRVVIRPKALLLET